MGSTFTRKYNIKQPAHFEVFSDMPDGIAREEQIKGWRRPKKIGLIESVSPNWEDVSGGWCE